MRLFELRISFFIVTATHYRLLKSVLFRFFTQGMTWNHEVGDVYRMQRKAFKIK